MADVAGGTGLLTAVLLSAWLFGGAHQPTPVKVYRIACIDSNTCRTVPVATYTAIPEAQAVIHTASDGIPVRMKGCAVRDAENWRCQDGDGPADLMVEGRFDTDNPWLTAKTVRVWEWWYRRIQE